MAHKKTEETMGEAVTIFWNHRVMKRANEEQTLFITKVFYDANGETMGWSTGEEVAGENLEEVRQTLLWMLESLDKPVLDESTLLTEAAKARENGDEDVFPSERLSLDEVLDSLGLDRSDLGDIVEHAEEPIEEPTSPRRLKISDINPGSREEGF